VHAVVGDPREASTLRAAGTARAAELFACYRNGTAGNVAVALRAAQLDRGRRAPLTAYVNVLDGELCVALRAHRIGLPDDPAFRLRFFTLEDIAARAVLDRYPAGEETASPQHTWLVGFQPISRAILVEMARRSPDTGAPVPVTVICPDGTGPVDDFLHQHPTVTLSCQVVPAGAVPELRPDQAVDRIVVALPDDEQTFRMALSLTQRTAGRRTAVAALVQDRSPFAEALTDGGDVADPDVYPTDPARDPYRRLAVLGVLDSGCDPDSIREDFDDRLARAVHTRYLETCAARGDSPQTNPSMVPWATLPPDLRASNLAQAADIGRKLQQVGCTVVPDTGETPAFAFTDEESEQLSRAEHERWMADRAAHGFVYGPVREGNRHPDLVEWEKLTDAAQDKDRAAVAHIPVMLARMGYAIIRTGR
jgi:hypothetical protein